MPRFQYHSGSRQKPRGFRLNGRGRSARYLQQIDWFVFVLVFSFSKAEAHLRNSDFLIALASCMADRIPRNFIKLKGCSHVKRIGEFD